MRGDTFGLVPSYIRANYEREEMIDDQVTAAFALYHALQAIDERLDLVFIPDRADREWGIEPGRWHVHRKNDPPAPDTYIPITTEDGGYREPDSGVLHEMNARDFWNRPMPKPEHDTPSAYREAPDPDRENRVEELAFNLRAGARVAGDGGINKRLWGRGGKKK